LAATAQSVQQSGSVTPGHAAQWITSGVVKDAGPATAGNLTELGITRNGGLPLCISTSLGAITGAPYQQMCLSVSSGGAGRIDLNAFNGASQLPFIIAIGGVPVFTSGTSPSNVPTVTRVTSGVNNSAPALFDQTIAWASATGGTKTQTIPTCTASLAGFKIAVKDEIRTASAAAPIRITPSGNTIESLASYPMPFPGGAVTAQCDGNANWMVL
jgi:hypothetical protein